MAAAPLPLCHDRALTDATDPDATCSDATDPTGPDPTHTDPTGPDPTPTAVVIRPVSLVDLDRPVSLVDLDRPGITGRHAMARRLERPQAMPTDILPAL